MVSGHAPPGKEWVPSPKDHYRNWVLNPWWRCVQPPRAASWLHGFAARHDWELWTQETTWFSPASFLLQNGDLLGRVWKHWGWKPECLGSSVLPSQCRTQCYVCTLHSPRHLGPFLGWEAYYPGRHQLKALWNKRECAQPIDYKVPFGQQQPLVNKEGKLLNWKQSRSKKLTLDWPQPQPT
jgi:hypothetical protein